VKLCNCYRLTDSLKSCPGAWLLPLCYINDRLFEAMLAIKLSMVIGMPAILHLFFMSSEFLAASSSCHARLQAYVSYSERIIHRFSVFNSFFLTQIQT
jgi:hypothetical protein